MSYSLRKVSFLFGKIAFAELYLFRLLSAVKIHEIYPCTVRFDNVREDFFARQAGIKKR